MDEYTERVSGMYKIINGLNKGEDVTKLRKQYIDRMDEIMFYNTDFDYTEFKENKKRVNRLSKELMVQGKYVGSKVDKDGNITDPIKLTLKKETPEYIEMWHALPFEVQNSQDEMAKSKALINEDETMLKLLIGWDEIVAKDRMYYYDLQKQEVEKFLKEYENYKNIK
jgi:hypothetical protein